MIVDFIMQNYGFLIVVAISGILWWMIRPWNVHRWFRS